MRIKCNFIIKFAKFMVDRTALMTHQSWNCDDQNFGKIYTKIIIVYHFIKFVNEL